MNRNPIWLAGALGALLLSLHGPAAAQEAAPACPQLEKALQDRLQPVVQHLQREGTMTVHFEVEGGRPVHVETTGGPARYRKYVLLALKEQQCDAPAGRPLGVTLEFRSDTDVGWLTP